MNRCDQMHAPAAFDPTGEQCWLARGRSAEHAAELARIWRTYPDLPPTAPLADRMARGRERIAAMKPVNDAIAARTEAERQRRNFALLEGRASNGTIADHDLAILRGRNNHGYDWDAAVAYASGWSAADAGRSHSFHDDRSKRQQARRAAYDRGFADGGGDASDVFDVARRSNIAAVRRDNQRAPGTANVGGRLPPSRWPKPTDSARPTRWSRRLLIVPRAEIDQAPPGRKQASGLRLLEEIEARPGADAMMIVSIDQHAGLMGIGCRTERPMPIDPGSAGSMIGDSRHGDALRAAFAGREIDDILVAVAGDHLPIVDAFADALPLCVHMERTQNSRLQQRAQLRCWLDRGHDGLANIAAGHIRWGKAINGLTGKLGEFTARHVGRAPQRGHLIRIETDGGRPADGYATASGKPLSPDITVSNKAHIRREMAAALRAFGAATRLMNTQG